MYKYAFFLKELYCPYYNITSGMFLFSLQQKSATVLGLWFPWKHVSIINGTSSNLVEVSLRSSLPSLGLDGKNPNVNALCVFLEIYCIPVFYFILFFQGIHSPILQFSVFFFLRNDLTIFWNICVAFSDSFKFQTVH